MRRIMKKSWTSKLKKLNPLRKRLAALRLPDLDSWLIFVLPISHLWVLPSCSLSLRASPDTLTPTIFSLHIDFCMSLCTVNLESSTRQEIQSAPKMGKPPESDSEDSGEGQGDDSGLAELSAGSTSSSGTLLSALSVSDAAISRVATQVADSREYVDHVKTPSTSSSASICSLLRSLKGPDTHPLFAGKVRESAQSTPPKCALRRN